MREQRELMIMSDERDKGPGMAYETSMWLDIFLEGAPPKARETYGSTRTDCPGAPYVDLPGDVRPL